MSSRDCGLDPARRSIDEVHCELWGEWMETAPARELAGRIKAAIGRAGQPGPDLFHRPRAEQIPGEDGLRHAEARRPGGHPAAGFAGHSAPAGIARPLRHRRAHGGAAAGARHHIGRAALRGVAGNAARRLGQRGGRTFPRRLHGAARPAPASPNAARSATATSCRRNCAPKAARAASCTGLRKRRRCGCVHTGARRPA